MKITDKEIIERVLNGEVRTFGILIDRHKVKSMALAMSILKNREDAEEALQDAFIRIFHGLSNFEWKSAFSTWMYRIVYNTCLTALEKRRDKEFVPIDCDTDPDKLPLCFNEMSADCRLESEEFINLVHEEIGKLPPVYGAAFTLFVIHEMSYDEIMKVTGMPLGTVKAKIFRARALLKEALSKHVEFCLKEEN